MSKKKCLIIINNISGNSNKIDRNALKKKFGTDSKVTFRVIKSSKDSWSAEGYHRLIVCGGDGTLNNALNKINNKDLEFFYLPCGTLNEYSKGRRKCSCTLNNACQINGKLFSYVAATGTFTPLGYKVSEKDKKRLRIFAYLLKVFSEFKVNNIRAKITFDKDESVEDNYTLIMALDSYRCFGFRFNRMYKQDDNLLHLLLIKSPGKNGFFNRIKLFFLFFRAFFIGFKKPYKSKNILFVPTKSLAITLEKQQNFCVDGELLVEEGKVIISVADLNYQINILPSSKR